MQWLKRVLQLLGHQPIPAKLSYIKLIGIWMLTTLLFTMIYPFAEIVVLCIQDVLKAKQGEETEQTFYLKTL